MDLNSYLYDFVNDNENISKLLEIIIHTTESRAGAIFTKNNNTYKCICEINKDLCEKSNVDLHNTEIYDIINCNENNNYNANFNISNNITIPVKNKDRMLGVLSLFNNKNPYNIDEVIYNITPIVSLLQIILKNILLEEKISILEKNEEKELFLANMSHEIRTPLNGVIGYNQLLSQTQLSSTQQGYLSCMNQCSIQLMQIINDILDFAKLSTGKMGINTECFSIKELEDIIMDAMSQRIKEKQQKCIFSISPDCPNFIILDKQKLIQILINLVSNANKFSDINTNIRVYFNIEEDNLIIRVIDNGIGISEGNLKKIFSAFEQVNNSNCTNGIGLGLAITKKLSKLLGGSVDVESVMGSGSIFTISVKYKPQENFEAHMKRDCALLAGKTVLVVDDNADNRIFLTEILFEWNMTPIVCASALEALRMVLSNRYSFDIGLIDICMPEICGSELAKQIKEEKPLLPLIALSSIDSFVNTSDFEQKLDKPINRLQLFNNIHHIISKKETSSTYLGSKKQLMLNDNKNICFDKNLRVLIAEDIIYNRNLLMNMINKIGYQNVDIAENGEIAIKMIEKGHKENNPYKILLLDLRMPIMDGYEVIDIHQQRNWDLPHIIVVTACILDEDRKKCQQMNVEYFINKPIDIKQLKEVMLYVSEK